MNRDRLTDYQDNRVRDIFRTAGDRFSYSESKYLSSNTRIDWSLMEKRRILIVDNNDELRVLERALGGLGHEIVVTAKREKAVRRDDLDSFDLIISDLSEDEVKAFKMGAANYLRLPYNRDELREIVEQTLSHKLRCRSEERRVG